MDQVLEQVKSFAAKAHEGQTRKYANEAYIQHPVRVMETCRQYTDDIALLSAALLHDVLEDTEVSPWALEEFLRSVMDEAAALRTHGLVVELTDVYTKAAYPKWNRRKRRAKEQERIALTSPDSQTVKYADIIDNGGAIVTEDPDFAWTYLHECRALLKVIGKGEPELYLKAVARTEEDIQRLKNAGYSRRRGRR